jgi:hypothetical protein
MYKEQDQGEIRYLIGDVTVLVAAFGSYQYANGLDFGSVVVKRVQGTKTPRIRSQVQKRRALPASRMKFIRAWGFRVQTPIVKYGGAPHAKTPNAKWCSVFACESYSQMVSTALSHPMPTISAITEVVVGDFMNHASVVGG